MSTRSFRAALAIIERGTEERQKESEITWGWVRSRHGPVGLAPSNAHATILQRVLLGNADSDGGIQSPDKSV